ncbi:PucR family transcriptional regulator [Marmoricola sp. RAF53]|uniref:PucR family transcriptional regulator n=1 Tax=Marmoricola sp. RAF53 TaxID=3233059 RepID=UPI003F99A342
MSVATPSRVTVGDVVAVKSWGLSVVAGAAGLDRPLTWAHVFDVPDPSQWVDGHELVIITGGHLPPEPDQQVEFVQRLDDKSVAGLAVGVRSPPISPELVAAADRLGFPLIQVPRETGHLPIVKFVAAANGAYVQKSLVTALQIFETLAPAQEDVTPRTRFRQIEKITGYRLYVVSSDGRALLKGMPDLPENLIEPMLGTARENKRWTSLAITNGYACGLRVGQRLAGFLVAQEQDDKPAAGLGAFRSIETVARLDVGTLYSRREAARRKGAELLGRYLHGVHPSQRAGDIKDGWGTNFAQGLVIAVVKAAGSASLTLQVDSEVHHQLMDARVSHLVLTEDERSVIALAAADVPVLQDITTRLPIIAGVSDSRGSLVDASVALQEAGWALEYGRREPGSELRSFVGGDRTWTRWLPSDPAVLRQLVTNTLGTLLEYDAARGGQLLESLRTYFEVEGRLQVAADRLHVHKHTLAYRLKRVEELTGLDLNSVGDRAELWFAVSAHGILSGR